MMTKSCVRKGSKPVKVLIDTDVVLDVLCGRQEFLEASAAVWKYCEVNKILGVISALSVPNIVYILRKELDPDKTKKIIDRLLLIFDVAELRAEDLRRAAEMKTADYEDAVKMCCAKRINADFIVTRNIRDFVSSPVPAVKPSELLDRI